MRARSKRMEAIYRDRRQLVAAMLEAHPVCQRCGRARSAEVHELKSRARGGSIVDEANCRALCHDCHRWITENPADAEADGWLLPSWAQAPTVNNPTTHEGAHRT